MGDNLNANGTLMVPSATSFNSLVACKYCAENNTNAKIRRPSFTSRRRSSTKTDVGEWRFYEYSTFHGVRDFFHAKSYVMRSVWALLLIFAVFCAFYGCYMIIIEYVRRPVVVSYFIKEGGRELALPDIVVCPFNRFNRSFLQEQNVSVGLAQYLELSFPSPVLHGFQRHQYINTIQNIDRYEYELEMLLERIGNLTYTEFIHRATLDCSAFFDENQFEPGTNFCQNLTETMTSAGKCFRIPGGYQNGDGFGYGTRLVIKLPHQLYNPGVNQLLNDGIAVKLVEQNRGIDHDLTFVPSGVHAIMPLAAVRYDFMNDPPRYMCDEQADQTYSRVWCFEICLTKDAEDTCGCSLAASAVPRKELLCTTKQFFHCFMNVLFSEKNEDMVEHCKSKCKAPCTYWQYQKSVSYARFPAPEAKFFVENESEWESLQHTIILEVYYTSLDYTVIKHMIAMTPNSFVAQIGGQVSLWIGGSIISLIQLIVYVCRYFLLKARRTYVNSRPPSSQSNHSQMCNRPKSNSEDLPRIHVQTVGGFRNRFKTNGHQHERKQKNKAQKPLQTNHIDRNNLL